MIDSVPKIIKPFRTAGIVSAYLVKKPSMIPAKMVKGTVLRNILKASLNPILKELNREKVFGKRIEAPRIKPAIASTTILKISKMPCSQIPFALSFKAPCS